MIKEIVLRVGRTQKHNPEMVACALVSGDWKGLESGVKTHCRKKKTKHCRKAAQCNWKKRSVRKSGHELKLKLYSRRNVSGNCAHCEEFPVFSW